MGAKGIIDPIQPIFDIHTYYYQKRLSANCYNTFHRVTDNFDKKSFTNTRVSTYSVCGGLNIFSSIFRPEMAYLKSTICAKIYPDIFIGA